MRELVFLDKLISSGAIYVLAAAIIVPFVYGLWTGRRESREADRRAYGRLTELFEIRPQRYVVRSLSKPDSSVVGSVDVAGDSITTLVLSGPNEIFIGNKPRDEYFSIPWECIHSIEQLSDKRVSLRLVDDTGRATRIVIPWSHRMTLEGWKRYKELYE